MTSFVLGPGPFPVGQTVGVYPRAILIGEGGPIGAVITTAVTSSALTTTFTGLDFDTEYWAAASVSGTWRKVAFATPVDPALSLDLVAINARVAATETDITALEGVDITLAAADAALDVRLDVLEARTPVYLRDYLPAGWVSGTTDVSTHVQSWVTAAAGGMGIAHAGTFVLTATITVGSNTTLMGQGAGSIFKHTGTGVAKCFANGDMAAFGNNSGIQILNLTVDRTASTSNDPYNNPIHMRYVDGLLVQGCRIRGGGSGCHVEACSNARILGNRVDSFTDKGISVSWATGFGGTDLTDASVLVANNTLRQTSATAHAAGSSPLLTTQDNTIFANNLVVNTDTSLGGFGIEFGEADDALAIGNTFIGCGVLVGSGKRIRVLNNTFTDGAVSGSAKVQVQVTGSATDPIRTVVANNSFYNTLTDGAALSVHTSATFTKLINNVIQGGGYCYLQASDCDVIGNVVEGAVHTGFNINTGSRIRILNNTARNCGTDAAGSATTKVGFVLDSLADPVISGNLAVSSNVATADMRNGFYINAGTGLRWQNNSSRGHTTGIMTFSGTTTWDNTEQFVTVASATAVTLPGYARTFLISGTTNITSIVATGWAGNTVTLKFAGILTFTDGSNLVLAGNLVTTADDTITLFCDGTNWVEVARAVN